MAELVRIEGLSKLNQALADFQRNVAKNVLRGAVRAAATVIREETKRLAPVKTGQLRRAVYLKQINEQSSPVRQVVYVGVRKGKQLGVGRSYGKQGSRTRSEGTSLDAYYAKWVEYGHFTRTSKANKEFTGPPRWISGKPFMRPAWESRKHAALEALIRYMRARIPQEAAKARR